MENKDKLLDLNGNVTLAPFKKSMLIGPLLAILVFVLCSQLPLQQYGDKAASALGFFLAIVVLFISQCWSIVITSMILVVGGFFLGFWDWGTFQASTGTSIFLQMTCMIIVAAGAETTPFGRRVALFMLKVFGRKPISIVLVLAVATGVLSAFIFNAGTLILISGIANTMLLTMHEEPGKSKLGRVTMLVIPMASMIGGLTLISGSPGSNVFGLGLLGQMSNGVYGVSYGQWAAVGIPMFLVSIIPSALIYVKCLKLKNSDVKEILPPEYYDGLLKELGPIGGSEIRWIIIVVGMVAWLIAGGHGTAVPVTCALIALLPVIGVVPASKVFNYVPMTIMFTIYMVSPMGSLFTTTGLVDWLKAVVAPVLSGMSPYVLCVVLTLVQVILTNVCVNAGSMVSLPVVLGVGIPVCEALGYNPALMLIPAIATACMWFMFTINSTMMLNHGYGWWDNKDGYVPGGLTLLFMSIVLPAIVLLVGPFAGMPIYL